MHRLAIRVGRLRQSGLVAQPRLVATITIPLSIQTTNKIVHHLNPHELFVTLG